MYFEKVLLDNTIISFDLDTPSNCSIIAKSLVLVVLLRSQAWVHSLLRGKDNLLTLSCGGGKIQCLLQGIKHGVCTANAQEAQTPQ